MMTGSREIGRRGFLALSGAAAFLPGYALGADPSGKADVITIGGAITEIAFALDQGHRIVARDTTSSFPPEATELPDVGYMRQLSAEGVLSYAPALIVSQEGAGPPEVIDILQAASVPFIEVPEGFDRTGVAQKITLVGEALGVSGAARDLAGRVDADLAAAEAQSALIAGARKRVLFVLSTQGGRIMASGTGTGADGIIRMAGAENAIASFEGYKPLSDEAVTAAAPDVILMMDRAGNHATSDDELFGMSALVATPAAAQRAAVRMNGLYLLGFGPRTAGAVMDLHQALYGEA